MSVTGIAFDAMQKSETAKEYAESSAIPSTPSQILVAPSDLSLALMHCSRQMI